MRRSKPFTITTVGGMYNVRRGNAVLLGWILQEARGVSTHEMAYKTRTWEDIRVDKRG